MCTHTETLHACYEVCEGQDGAWLFCLPGTVLFLALEVQLVGLEIPPGPADQG